MKRVVGIGVGLLLVFAVGVSLMRTRMRGGESPVIGDMRAMVSAQAAYASVNGGFYDRPGCLGKPAGCLATYAGPAFVGEMLARLPDQDGYARRFYPGPVAPPEAVAATGASPSSITSWALLSVPVGSELEEPRRSFCADDTGALRFALDPVIPALKGGRCPEEWALLQ